jgi:TolA-binding protein
MNKRPGLSPIGIAIAIVMLLGLLMIISAPVIVENNSKDRGEYQVERNYDKRESRDHSYEEQRFSDMSEYQAQIQYLESRISDLEGKINKRDNSNSSDIRGYNCSLESALDSDGEAVELTRENYNNPNIRYVFVCSKK